MSDPWRHELPTDYDSTTSAVVRNSALHAVSVVVEGIEIERSVVANGLPSAQVHYAPYADGATVYNSTYVTAGTITTLQATSTLMLENGVTVATQTIVFPPSPVDGQQFLMVSGATTVITTLTLTAGTGGATILNAPAATAQNTSYMWQYRAASNKWYRVF